MFEILVTSSTIFRSDVRFFPHEFPPWKWTERIIQSVLTAHCSVILSSDSAETTSIKIFNFLPKFFDVEFFIKSKQDGRPGHPGEGCLQDQAVVWNGARQRMPRCHQRCPRAASDRIQKLGQGLHLRLRLWTGDYVYLQALPSGSPLLLLYLTLIACPPLPPLSITRGSFNFSCRFMPNLNMDVFPSGTRADSLGLHSAWSEPNTTKPPNTNAK